MSGERLAFLVRHAVAASLGPRGDFERPLTTDGAGRFQRLLEKLGPLPIVAIRTSPFLRARQTADRLAAAIGVDVEVDERLASGNLSGAHLLKLIEPGVALVGHNPELSEAATLFSGRLVAMPPGAIAALRLVKEAELAWVAAPELEDG